MINTMGAMVRMIDGDMSNNRCQRRVSSSGKSDPQYECDDR